MTSPRFATGEAGGVQLHAVQTLARLGWRYVSRAEGEAARGGRLDQVILEDVLAERMMALNRVRQKGKVHSLADIGDAPVRELIGRLKDAAGDLSRGLLTANRRVTDMLRLGESVDIEIDGESRGRQLKFIDWETPANNRFQMTAEYPVRRAGRDDTRRPDIVLFVNGIPLGVIEVKSSVVETAQGISQQIRNQGPDEIPRLFAAAQLLIAANDSEPRYATTGTSVKFWSLWREDPDFGFSDARIEQTVNAGLDPEEASTIWIDFSDHRRAHDGVMDPAKGGRLPTPLDRTLVGLCAPERLLRIVRGFTLFDDGIKKIARYQQYFGVEAALARVRRRTGEQREGGVIWHTQGSGKSLTMVMLAGAIEREVPGARFVLVTDRIDLDDQLKQTFEKAGKQPEQATTGADLIRKLREKRPVVTTLIHKFKAGLASAGNFRDESADIFVLVDESHRSQTVRDIDSLHAQMRKALPNAAYIGFTGTPLLKRERSTFDRFGGLIHSYKIDQAVKDKAVVPLLYEGRHVELDVHDAPLDTWFERATKDLSEAQRADLKKRMARGEVIRGVEPHLREIAWDVSKDFKQTLKGTPYRAQLVAPGKREAVLFKRLLDEIGEVESAVVISESDDREGHEAVGAADDDDIVAAWEKEVTALQPLKTYEKNMIRAFKNGSGPEILIVVDKLLTGFDAPRNQTLYIARPLRDHKLLQAIARVNRLFSSEETDEEGQALYDKEDGRIVDYAGILADLDQALTAYSAFEGYDEGDVAEALVAIREEVEELPDKHAALLDLFKGVANEFDHEAYAVHLSDELIRRRFYDRLSDFARALETAFQSQDFRERTERRIIDNYKSDLRRFENLRRAVRLRYGDAEEDYDYRRYQAAIRGLLDKHIDSTDLIPVVPPVDIFDEDSFRSAIEEQGGTPASVADAITSAATRTITERMNEDPAFYRRFSRMVKDIIEDHRAGRLSEAEYLRRAKELRDELVGQAGGRGDDLPESVRGDPSRSAMFRQAAEQLSEVSGDQASQIGEAVALEFAVIVERHKRVGWINDPNAEKAMRQDMDDFLIDEIKGRRGQYALDYNLIDEIIDAAIRIAKRQAQS